MDFELPENMLCSKTHECIYEVDGEWVLGITDFAVEQLGDIVFVELPEVDAEFEQGEVFGTVESVKAASEIYAPVSFKVKEVNEEVITKPELLNSNPYQEGWLLKIELKDKSETDTLMEYDDYKSEAN
ncbi:MAG: glycine cleavage system protein GcvH [Candidatus Gastranaerophilales bacterium]|nr:glycine cleavage system protein GcvH [Candidatus Gastranaerophilales bacterium]